MVGKKVLHYNIEEKLGEGGMGVVFKAEDAKLERTVNFLPPQIAPRWSKPLPYGATSR
jgi:serine/threonine protein kinase